MKEYAFYRRKLTPLQMLWIITKSWFTSPPLALGCIFILLFMPFYFLIVLLQIVLFPLVLPVIALIYLPLSLSMYRKPEKNWMFWMGSYALYATFLSIIPLLFFYDVEGVPFVIGAFIILSAICGMCAYFNLYNAGNMEMKIEGPNE